tara:strand:+ start:4652 stop:5608 length:957 start_codon:yes stop_codon:yes gene_type:complete
MKTKEENLPIPGIPENNISPNVVSSGSSCELPTAPSVFSYIDYRKYLKDYYQYKKNSNSSFSYGSFARKAKIGTRNYLKRIIDGERNITKAILPKISVALDFDNESAIYFEYLVNYDQTKDPLVKKYYFEKLRSIGKSKKNSYFDINEAQYEVFQSWFYLPLYEYFALNYASSDPKIIQQHFRGAVSLKEIKEGIRVLQKLEIINWDEKSARYKQKVENIRFESEVASQAIQTYYKSMMDMAKSRIEVRDISQRDLRSLSIAINNDNYSQIINEIKDFVRHLNQKYSQAEPNKNALLQWNNQLIQLTQKIDSKTKEKK